MPSYEKSKSSGLWSCRFRETDENGITKNKRLSGFKTKKEAQYGYETYLKTSEQRAKELASSQSLQKPDANDMLFDDLVADFLAFTKNRVKESSYMDIESKYRNRLIPYFSGLRLSEISPKRISDWINGIDYSYSSKKWIFSSLSSMYKYGARYYDISNIMFKVDPPRNLEAKKEMQVWSPNEFNAFIDFVSNPIYAAYFTTLYLTGCRRGEGAALQWRDIDLAGAKITINKSVTNKTANAPYKITSPKNTSSNRVISIPSRLIAVLSSIRGEGDLDSFAFGPNGERPPATSTLDYIFRQAITASGVKRIRIHDLRHSCASLLISKGVSIVAVSKRLGHASIEQTLNTYSHLMPDDQSMILNALESI